MAECWAASKQEYGHWLFVWDADSADEFSVWLDGVLLDTVVGGEYDFELSGYEDSPPPLEIVGDGEDADSEMYPPFAILQWREVDGATAYTVEQLDSETGEWVLLKTIQDREAGYYCYFTEVLADQEGVSFRVSAVDSRGNAGTPVTFSFCLVHNPAPPLVVYQIDEDGDLVVEQES